MYVFGFLVYIQTFLPSFTRLEFPFFPFFNALPVFFCIRSHSSFLFIYSCPWLHHIHPTSSNPRIPLVFAFYTTPSLVVSLHPKQLSPQQNTTQHLNKMSYDERNFNGLSVDTVHSNSVPAIKIMSSPPTPTTVRSTRSRREDRDTGFPEPFNGGK